MTLRSGLPEVVEFSGSWGGVALRPVTPAVMAQQPLDDNVVSSHGYTTMPAAELIRLASRPDSRQRSIDRVADPPREVKELLRSINETRDFWKALRKHGTVQQCKSWLQTMVQHSTWHEVRETDPELLRKEYLRLWDECKFYDPEFVDHEMKERQRAAGIVDVFPQGGDKGGPEGWREGRPEGWREGRPEGWREGSGEGWREGWRQVQFGFNSCVVARMPLRATFFMRVCRCGLR